MPLTPDFYQYDLMSCMTITETASSLDALTSSVYQVAMHPLDSNVEALNATFGPGR